MILGYLCNYSEGEVKRATRLGFQCLEVHARSLVPDLDNPKGLDKIAGGVNGALHANNISISAISHYDTNILTYPVKKAVKRYRGVFELAKKLGVGVIPSMAGNLPDAPYAEGMKAFARSFREIAKLADDMGMKIAFENWPGIGGDLPWKPKNLAWNPRQWAAMFDAVPSKAPVFLRFFGTTSASRISCAKRLVTSSRFLSWLRDPCDSRCSTPFLSR
ncbi:MAG: sugar phosphate isomerase/epimerase [Acidobacteria bacterium]|nr:sugar phosphate isomerase/epimerase [Acidobacteriota bacterium]